MTARDCASMLRNNRIFQSVGEDRLERLVENADMQTFRRGDEILSPSRGGRIMGMIITGSAAVNKGRAVINTLVPGDIFGAVTLFSDEPSPATTVTARVECSAVFFEKDAIAELIESEPGAAIGFAAYLSARIRFLTRRIEALTAGDSASKLLSYLLEREQDGEVDIQSCAELARRLDVGRASLYRALDSLETSGDIRREGKKFLSRSRIVVKRRRAAKRFRRRRKARFQIYINSKEQCTMKKFTKILSLLLCLAMVFSFAACTGKTDDSATTTEETVSADTTPINITTLKGPTGMGMAKLISDKNAQYNISIATAATEIAPLIIKGEADIAACPLNLAAAIYKKTGGKVKMIAINTLGVLSILENGESIKSVADLKGKKIGATGQSATPEYVLNYILEANGIDPKKDVEITYYTDHAELATLMATGKIDIAMLPEPNVTTVMAKNNSVRKALDLTEEWEKATAAKGEKTSLAQGCLIVRAEFLEAHPNAVKAFLAAYKESVDFVNGNTEKAAQMIADAGIVPNAQIAAKALPNCNIVYMTGDEMIKTAKANFDVLFKADPTSVGGAMPGDDLYYTGK